MNQFNIDRDSALALISKQLDAAESLYQIGLTISSSLDIEKILSHAVNEMYRLLEADFCWYMELHEQTGKHGIVRNISGIGDTHVDTGQAIIGSK